MCVGLETIPTVAARSPSEVVQRPLDDSNAPARVVTIRLPAFFADADHRSLARRAPRTDRSCGARAVRFAGRGGAFVEHHRMSDRSGLDSVALSGVIRWSERRRRQ